MRCSSSTRPPPRSARATSARPGGRSDPESRAGGSPRGAPSTSARADGDRVRAHFSQPAGVVPGAALASRGSVDAAAGGGQQGGGDRFEEDRDAHHDQPRCQLLVSPAAFRIRANPTTTVSPSSARRPPRCGWPYRRSSRRYPPLVSSSPGTGHHQERIFDPKRRPSRSSCQVSRRPTSAGSRTIRSPRPRWSSRNPPHGAGRPPGAEGQHQITSVIG